MTIRTVLLVGALVAVSSCGQSSTPTGPTPSQAQAASVSPPGPASVTVSIATSTSGSAQTESFDPDSVTISPGTQVNWINDDDVTHVLAADDGSWSGTLDSEDTFSHTFPNAGTFHYHDAAHPQIGGTVVVK